MICIIVLCFSLLQKFNLKHISSGQEKNKLFKNICKNLVIPTPPLQKQYAYKLAQSVQAYMEVYARGQVLKPVVWPMLNKYYH